MIDRIGWRDTYSVVRHRSAVPAAPLLLMPWRIIRDRRAARRQETDAGFRRQWLGR